jgi:hypothetical protein
VIEERRMPWAKHVTRVGETINADSILVLILEGRRPLGKPKYRWENNFKTDVKEVARFELVGSISVHIC